MGGPAQPSIGGWPRGQGVPAGSGCQMRACGAPIAVPGTPFEHFLQPPDLIDVATEGLVIRAPHAELDGRHDGRRGHSAKTVVGHAQHIGHHGDAATGPDVGGGPATGHVDQSAFDGACEQHRVLSDARAQAAPRAAQKQHRHQRGLAVLTDAVHDAPHFEWHGSFDGGEVVVQHIPAGVLTGGGCHEQTQARPGHGGVPALNDGQGIGNVGPPHPVPGFATWKYRPGVDLRPRI